MKEPDGVVHLRFRCFCEPTNLPSTSPGRKSFSDFHSDRGVPIKQLQNYLFRSPIAEPVINDPPSPSSPEIGYRYNVLTKPNFSIHWPFLKEDYYSTNNASKCQSFKQIDRTLEKMLKRNGLLTCKSLLTHFPCPLFESTKSNGGRSRRPNSEGKKM